MSSNYSKEQLTQLIKNKAKQLGFYACGVASAQPIDHTNRSSLENWLTKGYHAEMHYLANHLDKRCDPRLLEPGTKSIIAVALNYYPSRKIPATEYQLSWYAYGKDYHDLMRDRMKQLYEYIQTLIPIQGRCFCDTAPILDRYWAWKAGLGWIGKNTQLIIPHAGPTFFLGEILVDIALAYDSPQPSRCGNCTRCLQACPSQALEEAYLLNANRCISYQTIENKKEISKSIISSLSNKIYGCDDCIKKCPWVRFAQPTQEDNLQISDELLRMKQKDWHTLSQEQYQQLFQKSAVKRAKYAGLIRNIKAINHSK